MNYHTLASVIESARSAAAEAGKEGQMISASSAAGVGYYAGGGSEEARDASGRNYYTGAVDHGERPGQWSGKLADALGLTGVVDAKDMEAVYEQFVTPDGQPIGHAPRNYQSPTDRLAAALAKEPDALPERIEEIRLMIERGSQSTCRGVDLTASVPKSVTVAYVAVWRAAEEARSDGQSTQSDGYAAIQSALDGAILAANQTALDSVAGVATTRMGKHGNGYAGQWVSAPSLVVASFPQLTSRAGDPQFHIHNVVLNRAQTEDGRIGALDTRDLGQQRHGYSAVFDRSLAENLGAMGVRVEWRGDGKSWEIVGIDQEALDTFSQRRAQITKAMEPIVSAQEERLGRELNALERSRIAQTVNIATREAKDKGDIDWTEKLAGWTEQLTDEIGMGLTPVAAHVQAMIEDSSENRAQAPGFSPDAVIARARFELAQEKAAWTRADAYLAVDRALPAQLGMIPQDAAALTGQLTDRLLESDGVVQVAGTTGIVPPSDLASGTFVRPSDAKYATPETLEAENLILRATGERRGASLDPKAVDGWLAEHYPTIQADQRAAVIGLASTDAALSQIVGPAGTGKSFTMGALAGAWNDLSDGGRVIGLATSKVASEVLKGDGVEHSFTIAAWRAMEGRLASGNPRGDEIVLTDRDLVVMDETSMVDTPDLDRIRAGVEAAGARAIASGDPAQLGAVGAGGGMGLLAGSAETYTLTDVRRFDSDWEGKASLGLRSGDLNALREYDRHGRFVEVDTMSDALQAAARAAAAAVLDGKSVSVTADSNNDAYRLGDMVREHLVAAGVVEEQGIVLARSDQVAGLGDQVVTRQIDYGLGVLNGTRFEVVGTGDDGSLSVRADDGTLRELPAEYVSAHVHLGYASTVHLAQGRTVDVGFTVTGGATSASALYVGMTRGRESNRAFVALQPFAGEDWAPGVVDPHARPSAATVLSEALERESESQAALMEQRADAERNASVDTLMGRIEEMTHKACRSRLDDDLDRLVEDGVLDTGDRARLAADQSTDHLSRVCRAAEQAGLDPALVLREAIEERSLDGAKSVAQVIAGRITSEHDVCATQPGAAVVPERVSDDTRTYLELMHAAVDERAATLGSAVSEDQPSWAVKALGPVPQEAVDRLEWEAKAGAIAAFREAKGLEGADRVLPASPGLSQPEARAAWWGAWEALGRPQETRVEAGMTDGALQARVAAWQREQAWAPAHADASLRQAALDAQEARQEAILARASGDEDAAARWEQEAAERQSVADAMDVVSQARGEWAAQTTVTQDLAGRASAELKDRGLEPGHEPDRVTAEEWLEHQRQVDEREEAVTDITELDVPIVDPVDAALDSDDSVTQDERADVSEEAPRPRESSEVSVHPDHDPARVASPTERDVDADEEAPVGVAGGGESTEHDTVRESEQVEANTAQTADSTEPETSPPPADPVDDAPRVDRSPTHHVAPIEPDDVEQEALIQTARDASERIADRESEEAAHAAWEAEQEASAPEDAPVDEAVSDALVDA